MATKRKTKTPAPAPTAETAPAANADEPKAPRLVTVRLGEKATVGALIVGNARVEAKRPARIPRAEFDRLKREYDLIEVKE